MILRVLMVLVLLLGVGAERSFAYDGSTEKKLRDKAMSPGAKGKLIEDVETMFRKMARSRNRHGLKLFRDKDLPGALKAFQEAYELDAGDPEITNNLALCYELLGIHERAEEHYRETIALDPERGVAYQNLGALLSHPDASNARLREAAKLLQTARELRGNIPVIIFNQARVARWLGKNDEAKRFYERYVKEEEPSDAKRFEMAEFYRSIGAKEKALRWYRSIEKDDDLKRKASTRMWDIKVSTEAERYGWSSAREEVSADVIALAEQARTMMRNKDFDGARKVLNDCIARAPAFARAHMSLGDIERQAGALSLAELSYLRALAIKPGSAANQLRLADLYLTEGVVYRPAAGAIHLSRALELRPEWVRLHLRLARVYQAMGDINKAREHVGLFLASNPEDELKEQAERLKRSLGGLPDSTETSTRVKADDGPEISALVRTLNRARVLLSRGKPDAAMAQLRSLENHDSNSLILNLEARILHAAGRSEEALECLRKSLAIQQDQPEILELQGLWNLEQGALDRAEESFLKAEKMGSTHAGFYLARLSLQFREAELGLIFSDLFRIQELRFEQNRLTDYLIENPDSVYVDEAQDYLDGVEARLRNLVIFACLFLLLVSVVVLVWRRKVLGGVGVRELLERHPEAGPEVQRILSAIRHEVLKHNTMVLTGLIDALEERQPLGDKAQLLHKGLFGSAPGEGVAQRLKDYCTELEGLGRVHRLRLNLRHQDPVMGPLLLGFRNLKQSITYMAQGEISGERRRRRLIRDLSRSNHALNIVGYQGIMEILDGLRTLRMDDVYLESLYDRTLREPAMSQAVMAPLQWLDSIDLPCWALIPRHAMDDILTNILRNAVQSSVQHGEEPIEIGLRVDSELDPITGIERVSVLVLDKSPQVLTTEMLRGRYIADGLGLTADLVSQFEGSLDVVSVDGWQKAVRVRVPRIHPEKRKNS